MKDIEEFFALFLQNFSRLQTTYLSIHTYTYIRNMLISQASQRLRRSCGCRWEMGRRGLRAAPSPRGGGEAGAGGRVETQHRGVPAPTPADTMWPLVGHLLAQFQSHAGPLVLK